MASQVAAVARYAAGRVDGSFLAAGAVCVPGETGDECGGARPRRRLGVVFAGCVVYRAESRSKLDRLFDY
jgi:hypothetical protein